jgi:hypothetical protein
MRAKEATKILNCSNSTLANWIKSGKIRINKILPNGYRDIDDESVYEAAASSYRRSPKENRIVMFGKDGSVHTFETNDDIFKKLVFFCENFKAGNIF